MLNTKRPVEKPARRMQSCPTSSARFLNLRRSESRKRGLKLISVHKGYSYQSRTLGRLANPKDVEKAALRNPDFNFVVYHSAIKHGSSEPNWEESKQYDQIG